MSGIIEELKQKIKGKNIKIVFPESSDERIVEAAGQLALEGLLIPILIGDHLKTISIPKGCEVIIPSEYPLYNEMVQRFVERRQGKCSYDEAIELIKTPNYFGTMLVYMGIAQGLVSGAIHSTSDTVRPALQIIKTKPNITKTFGYFVMVREKETYIFADCAINPNPDAKTLAEFAVESARAAKMFGLDPKVAMLSFSTNLSADTEETQKVREATQIAKSMNSEFDIDGEMQFDAAFVRSVGKSKYPGSLVAGSANTFIFPDLNSGNIGYKIAQRLGGFEAIGPILAGLNQPLNDLSRGCSVLDVYNTAIITAAQTLIE